MSSAGLPGPPTAASSAGTAKKKGKKKKNQKPTEIPNSESRVDNVSQEADLASPRDPEASESAVPDGHAATGETGPSNRDDLDNEDDDNTHIPRETMTASSDALHAEVEALRKELETVKSTHDAEIQQLKTDLEESEAAREEAEEQYENLHARVTQIKEKFTQRLQQDKDALEEAKSHVVELEAANEDLVQRQKDLETQLESYKAEISDAERELSSLRSRSNLSQTNWQRERDDLVRYNSQLKDELASTTTAMGEWEVIAMEERSRGTSLAEQVTQLEEQVAGLRESYERAAQERDSNAMAITKLQKSLQDLNDTRRRELRELVESNEVEIATVKNASEQMEKRANDAESQLERLRAEVERTAPFEKEVKEKNLLIGKLRHEAIVLNDHLTKALKYLKKHQPDNQIDRAVVTNHLLQFLALDRADPKRFQILQIIAAYLKWTDDEKSKAGLLRGGMSSSTLRLPQSPFHRTPSNASLNSEFFTTDNSASKDSLSDLWANFLERSAEEGSEGTGRKDSISTSGG